MGAVVCCSETKSLKSNNLRIYQINRYYSTENNNNIIYEPLLPVEMREPDKKESTINDSSLVLDHSTSELPIKEENSINNFNNRNIGKKRQCLKNENGEFRLLSYDIEDENYKNYKIIFPIIKNIEGLSELIIKTDLYLCGISSKQNNEGSFLFKINLNTILDEEEIRANILINSQFQHIYPSLIECNDQIICVGGKGQINCELYNNDSNKWFSLPQLPEERYKCTLCKDPRETYIYLFGGITTKENHIDNDNKIIYKILRLDIEKQLVWENLLLKNDSKNMLINRFSAGSFTFKNDEDFIFLIGGQNFENKLLDDVIRFSIHNLKFEKTGIKLKYKTKFFNQHGILGSDQTYFFIDSQNQIHTIDRHDCLPLDYHPMEI